MKNANPYFTFVEESDETLRKKRNELLGSSAKKDQAESSQSAKITAVDGSSSARLTGALSKQGNFLFQGEDGSLDWSGRLSESGRRKFRVSKA